MKKLVQKSMQSMIILVWIVNGFYCKVLNAVPRHELIVREITGWSWSDKLTIAIGFFEIGMAFWILSNYWRKMNMLVQVLIVLTMNILEFLFVPDLLLWGRYNSVFALGFIVIVIVNYRLQTSIENER
jgi:hypothetical protein